MSNPCECIHEAMIRRLLNILRESQADCIDGECDDTTTGTGSINTVMMFAMLSFFAAIMFFTRPSSMRSIPPAHSEGKPARQDDDDNGPPPPGLH